VYRVYLKPKIGSSEMKQKTFLAREARTKYSRTWAWKFRLGEQRVVWVGDVWMALNSAELEGSASV
jgi:hypothetical protein